LLIPPTRDDWTKVKEIWEDPETMEAVGGGHPLSKEQYDAWYMKLFKANADKNQYFLVIQEDDRQCIGEVSFHGYDSMSKRAHLNIKIKKEYRKKGLGKKALDGLLQYYFNEWGGEVMEDHIWTKNKEGYESLTKYGFQEVQRDSHEILVEMTKEEWRKRQKT